MRLLLDTHAFLWFITGDPRLTRPAYEAITDPGGGVWLSVGSLWEIAIKSSLGKLPLPGAFEDVVPAQLEAERIGVLPIEMTHLAALRTLPFHHRDPFDRLIVAQALVDGSPHRDARCERGALRRGHRVGRSVSSPARRGR